MKRERELEIADTQREREVMKIDPTSVLCFVWKFSVWRASGYICWLSS